jgi:hypothetical protein
MCAFKSPITMMSPDWLYYKFAYMCKVSRNVSITSWNVNGLLKKSTSQKLCKLDDNNFSKYMQSDIICLSETHAQAKTDLCIMQ